MATVKAITNIRLGVDDETRHFAPGETLEGKGVTKKNVNQLLNAGAVEIIEDPEPSEEEGASNEEESNGDD